jgi:acetyl esterase
MKAYVPEVSARQNPFVAPLQAVDKTGLPPLFMAVAEYDPLHDDGIEYARQLERVGVQVCIHEGKGLMHGYTNALSYSSAAREAFRVACDWLRNPQ